MLIVLGGVLIKFKEMNKLSRAISEQGRE